MKIYHSFWEKSWGKLNANLYNMHKLSVLTALKNYGNITLITTEEGKKFLGDLPYTNIEIFEDEIPIKYKDVWSISKLFAYKQICKKNEPFLHIDYDVFLFKKLPNWYLNSAVVFQSIEKENQIDQFYNLDAFFRFCKNKYLGGKNTIYACNMALFGGHDINSIKFYLDEAFKLLFDEENKSYWLDNTLTIAHCSRAVIIEQWYLVCCLNRLNVKPTSLFKGWPSEEEAVEYGYCHIWGSKSNQTIHEKISKKILKLSEN
jgi:hypothetical protein